MTVWIQELPAKRIVLGNPADNHLYSVGVDAPSDGQTRKIFAIEVVANNRAAAGAIAKRAGYSVRDVNMIG